MQGVLQFGAGTGMRGKPVRKANSQAYLCGTAPPRVTPKAVQIMLKVVPNVTLSSEKMVREKANGNLVSTHIKPLEYIADHLLIVYPRSRMRSHPHLF